MLNKLTGLAISNVERPTIESIDFKERGFPSNSCFFIVWNAFQCFWIRSKVQPEIRTFFHKSEKFYYNFTVVI